jgi:hypothetical protein
MRSSVFVALALSTFAVGCRGKVVGTAVLSGPGSADVEIHTTGAPLTLWADTDGEWHGGSHSHFAAHYEIDVLVGGASIGHLACDTNDVSESVCGTKITNGNDHRGDCELKLTCSLPSIPAGTAKLHVVGTVGAGTSNVRKMSINVREK